MFCINVTVAQNIFTLNVGKIREREYNTTLPFEVFNKKIIINVLVNNKNRRFIVDTGAPTSFKENLLAEIKHKNIGKAQLHDANSKEAEYDIVQISGFSVNGFTLKIIMPLKFRIITRLWNVLMPMVSLAATPCAMPSLNLTTRIGQLPSLMIVIISIVPGQ
ncbi:hypothetical protein CHU92_04880 [Flavobacterium cyanobacteriorum]|uniref:Peptidase A2 domain-containing protein n=1 Tax=Flavobacterium cyanobacteriorum TaxID=2022802 RepID=A0A255ZD88_9FLAO|nr:hypothetical protein CHU92_04880 [Flavobacterium cyanobacteriorum]